MTVDAGVVKSGRAKSGLVKSGLLAAIRFYSRAISPALPPRCRFYPTCSAYAAEAITRHGAGRGSWLALRRLLKCAPWHPGGIDLVPGGIEPKNDPGTPGTSHSSSTAEARPASPADGARRPDLATRPPATPPHWRRAPHEESSVA
jgi:putative membrane protein insertion efficiency factor